MYRHFAFYFANFVHVLFSTNSQHFFTNKKSCFALERSSFQIFIKYEIYLLFNAVLACSANAVNAAASVTAISANILRLTSISANLRPCINVL